jgi:hypothetical protein
MNSFYWRFLRLSVRVAISLHFTSQARSISPRRTDAARAKTIATRDVGAPNMPPSEHHNETSQWDYMAARLPEAYGHVVDSTELDEHRRTPQGETSYEALAQ